MPSSAPSSLNPFRTLQRHRNFRLFWFGQTLSLIGTWMQAMAEGWLALELSDSAFVVGLVVAAASAPVLLLSLNAGVVVDRTDKLKLLRVAQTLFTIQASLYWWFVWSHHITVGWILVLATSNGVISAFEIPTRQSLIIELVGKEDLPGAIALNSSGFNLARVIGPSIGALVIAQFGIAWCFGVNAISYFAVLVGLFMIQLPAWVRPESRASPLAGIVEGFRFMRDTPSISALLLVIAVYSVFGTPYLTLMPVVARNLLGLGAAGYGLLLACVGVGGLTGALGLAAAGDRFPLSVVLTWSSLTFAALLLAFAFVRSPAVAYPLLLGVGFTMIVNNAGSNALLQHLVPNQLRGRMMAAYSFLVVGLSQVLGSFIGGAVAGAVGVDWAIGGGAVIMLVFAYVLLVRRPELRNV